MQQYLKYALLGLALLWGQACSDDPADDPLIGHWEAYAAQEEGRDMAVNLDEISLQFEPDGTYHFNTTLNRQEAGKFSRRKDRLTTQDTLATGAEPKTVQIALLEADTLVLLMQDSGKERKLSLRRTH